MYLIYFTTLAECYLKIIIQYRCKMDIFLQYNNDKIEKCHVFSISKLIFRGNFMLTKTKPIDIFVFTLNRT